MDLPYYIFNIACNFVCAYPVFSCTYKKKIGKPLLMLPYITYGTNTEIAKKKRLPHTFMCS